MAARMVTNVGEYDVIQPPVRVASHGGREVFQDAVVKMGADEDEGDEDGGVIHGVDLAQRPAEKHHRGAGEETEVDRRCAGRSQTTPASRP